MIVLYLWVLCLPSGLFQVLFIGDIHCHLLSEDFQALIVNETSED